LLAENMALQARSGADTVAVLDTCAGEFDAETYREIAVPVLSELLKKFEALCPNFPITYYSKGSGPEHWKALRDLPIACLGIDWNHNIAEVLDRWSDQWAIQGNVDPSWLFLETDDLESRLRKVFNEAKALPQEKRRGWVSGLGHGVLPKTPEAHVHLFLRLQKEIFG
jgi:uroporphyrinogen decarboxylase